MFWVDVKFFYKSGICGLSLLLLLYKLPMYTRLDTNVPSFTSLGLIQEIYLSLGTVITAHEQASASWIPGSGGQPETVTLRQAVGGAAGRVRGREDVLVARHAICRCHGVVGATRQLGEGDLDDLFSAWSATLHTLPAKLGGLTESRRRLSVPGPVEGHVHVRGVGVEGVPDGRAVGLEGQARGDGLAIAAGVVEGAVGAENEVAARLEGLVVGEGRRVPDGEAGRVAVPCVSRLQGVTDWR
jgi:hypothetical protein